MYLFVFKAAVCNFPHNKIPTKTQDLLSIIRMEANFTQIAEYNDVQTSWDVYHFMALQAWPSDELGCIQCEDILHILRL